MSINKLEDRYYNMSIDQLASVLDSYDEKDFTPEAQKVIKEVTDAREKELEAYRKKKIDYENSPMEGIRLQKSKLFGIIFLIPLIAFCIAEGTQIHFNSELRSAIRKEFPDANSEYISKVTIDNLCRNPSPDFYDICITNRNLNLISAGALLAGVIGLALLISIRIAGHVARNSRKLLLKLFKPGIYLSAITLSTLMIVHAAIAMASIYYAEIFLIGRIHIFIIGAIGIGALGGAAILIKNIFSLIHEAETKVIGLKISHERAPKLWKIVNEIVEKLGALHPDQIVVGLEPNYFVTEADVLCLDGKLSGRTLYCSLPFFRLLDSDELTAVIGHELAHFKGLDTEFSQKFFPIYRGTASAILSLQKKGGEGSKMLALLPAIAILSYFLECFSIAESRISRIRELRADKEGANVSRSVAMATALVKLHAFAPAWNTIQEASLNTLQKGQALINISKTFADTIPESLGKDLIREISGTHLVHPTDSHPPLIERLNSLQIRIEDMIENAIKIQPAKNAINLIPHVEKIEERVSDAYQTIIAQMLDINYASKESDSELKNENKTSDILECSECGFTIDINDVYTDQLICPECNGRLEYA